MILLNRYILLMLYDLIIIIICFKLHNLRKTIKKLNKHNTRLKENFITFIIYNFSQNTKA